MEPSHHFSRDRQDVELLAFLALFGTSVVLHRRMSADVATPAARHGMLSLLGAGSVARDRQILGSWDRTARAQAVHNLRLDPVFSVTWTAATGLACRWARGPLGQVRPAAAAAGAPLAWAQCLAAVLSSLKDLALLSIVHHGPRQPWPTFAAGAGLVEITIKSAGVAYAGAGGLAWALRRAGLGTAL